MSSVDSDRAAVVQLQDRMSHTQSPSQTIGSAWSESHPQPKIFPGIVHERARRSSMRQGSGSEKDSEQGASLVKSPSRLGQGALDDGGFQNAVVEEEGREP